MVRKKETTWITGKQAATILTQRSGHPISDRYVRRLAERGVIASQEITNRMKLYSKEDTEECTVRERGTSKTTQQDKEASAA